MCVTLRTFVQSKPRCGCQALKRKPTVMVVDDDPVVLRVSRLVLTQDEFEVIEAQSGEEVLRMFELSPDLQVDAMICDVAMPIMDGLALSEKVRELRPGLPVLFLSGYGENLDPVSTIVSRKLAFIRKPFTSRNLTEKVRELLSNASSASPDLP